MSNFITRKIREYRCKKSLKCYCDPSEDFLCETKKIFLSKIGNSETREEFRVSIFSWQRIFKYSFAGLLSLAILSGGAAVYADKTNVDSGHPLYELKRAVEAVRVELAPAEELPVLHTELAQRRLDEIKKIESEVSTSIQETASEEATTTEQINVKKEEAATTTIKVATTTKKASIPSKIQDQIKAQNKKRQDLMNNLRNQMRQEVDDVFKEMEQKKIKKDNAPTLCKSVSQIIKEDEKRDGDAAQYYAKNWARLQKNCGSFIDATSTDFMRRN
jgi:hypothetical protein